MLYGSVDREEPTCDAEKTAIKKDFSPTAEMKPSLLRLSRKRRGKKREDTYARPEVTSFGFGLLSFAA